MRCGKLHQLRGNSGTLTDEGEACRRRSEAIEMPLAQRETAILQAQGFDQAESRISLSQERRLQQAFPVFRIGLRIPDDATANAVAYPSVALDLQRPDRHGEREIAAGPYPAECPV